jgi:hypothetical protein
MARVASSFQTYDAKGNREDLADIIYNISPTDTPIMSASQRRGVDNTQFDWQTDTLAATDSANAQVEGFIEGGTTSAATTRLRNVTQISKKSATVTGSQQAENSAGRKNEMAYQLTKRSKELKRDMETIASGTTQALDFGTGGTGTETPRKTRAIEHWLGANVSVANTMGGTGYVAPGSETGAVTDGTQRAFTETLLQTAMQLAYGRGAYPPNLIVGPAQKRTVSTFVGRTNAREITDEKSVVATVTLYASDFGDIKVVPSRYIRNRSALLLDFDYLAFSFFRNFTRTPLAKTGDADVNLIVVEWGVEMRSIDAHQLIADLT